MTSFEVSRIEYKYLLDLTRAAELSARLRRGMMPDPHNGANGYRVKSLYFDTWDDTDYCEKEAGIKDRRKLRLRIYDEGDTAVKLECKQKDGDFQRKVTVPLTRGQAQRILAGDICALLEVPGPRAAGLYAQLILRRPVGVVEYDRMAFCWPTHNIRITLDSRVRYAEGRSGLFDPLPASRSVLDDRRVILEVKYDLVLEPFVRDLLKPYCGSRFSYGKYEQARRA